MGINPELGTEDMTDGNHPDRGALNATPDNLAGQDEAKVLREMTPEECVAFVGKAGIRGLFR